MGRAATHAPLEVEAADAGGVGGDDEPPDSPPRGPDARWRRAPTSTIAFNVVAFMLVPRAIPSCFASTGWALGIVALLYSTVVTYDTGILLGRVAVEQPLAVSGTYPALTAEAAGRWSASRGHSDASQARLRAAASTVVACLQHGTFYLTGVTELIYFEQYCGQLFDASPLCQWQWLLIVSLLALPVMQLPSFTSTRLAALWLGVLPLALNVGVFVFEVFRVVPWRCSPGPSYSPPTASSAFVGMTALAYAFGGHGMYPEQIREMASPREWPRVMRMTWVVLVPLYWGCGILGYAAYGDYAQANLNLNFPDGEQNKRTY